MGRWVVGDRAPIKKEAATSLFPPGLALWEDDFRPVSQRDRAASIVPVLRRRPEPHQLTFSHLRLSALRPNREFRPSRLVFDQSNLLHARTRGLPQFDHAPFDTDFAVRRVDRTGSVETVRLTWYSVS